MIECIRKTSGFAVGDIDEVIKYKCFDIDSALRAHSGIMTKDFIIYAIDAFKKHQSGLDQ